jgi:hypothetical protein
MTINLLSSRERQSDQALEFGHGLHTEIVEVTVGTGGEFPSFTKALEELSRAYPAYKRGGIKVEVKARSSFVMEEQLFIDGIDLGFITLTDTLGFIPVSSAGISESLFVLDTTRPLIAGVNKAVLPRIGCLFDYSTAVNRYDGIALSGGSEVQFLAGPADTGVRVSGVKNGRRGLVLLGGAKAYCHIDGLTQGGEGAAAGLASGPDFSGSSNRAMQLQHGARADLPRASFKNSTGDASVYCIWGSSMDIYQSDASGNATGDGILVRDGSGANCREVNASDCDIGFHAIHGSTINARYKAASVWAGDGASRCGSYGVLANDTCSVSAPELPVTGSNVGFHASSNSDINAELSDASACAEVGYKVLGGSKINALGGTGTANVTTNAWTVNGFISK